MVELHENLSVCPASSSHLYHIQRVVFSLYNSSSSNMQQEINRISTSRAAIAPGTTATVMINVSSRTAVVEKVESCMHGSHGIVITIHYPELANYQYIISMQICGSTTPACLINSQSSQAMYARPDHH